jgi:hypothetical protein
MGSQSSNQKPLSDQKLWSRALEAIKAKDECTSALLVDAYCKETLSVGGRRRFIVVFPTGYTWNISKCIERRPQIEAVFSEIAGVECSICFGVK